MPSRIKTRGQIKALAQSFKKNEIVGFYDHRTNIAVEAHLYKIERAETNRKFYSRAREKRQKMEA